MEEEIYGLDFGTSNSAIAIYFPNGQIKLVGSGRSEAKTLPSLIYFDESRYPLPKIGFSAIDAYIGSQMKGRFIQSIKSFLPDDIFRGTNIGFKLYGIQDLISLILIELKAKADALIGKDIKSVVLGRPAKFSENSEEDDLAQKRLIGSAEKAGFKNIYIQFEPIAAALVYESRLSAPELVLVVDSGGGTTDITVMKLNPAKNKSKDRKGDILATEGIYSGGDLYSSQISESKLLKLFGEETVVWTGDKWLPVHRSLFQAIIDWKRIAFLKSDRSLMETLDRNYAFAQDKIAIGRLRTLIRESLGYKLFMAIDKAKCDLSSNEMTFIDFDDSGIFIHEPLMRVEFEEIMVENLAKISKCIDKALANAGISPSGIGAVFATGGSSYIPCIIDLLRRKFSHCEIKGGDTFNSVAKGLAMSAVQFF